MTETLCEDIRQSPRAIFMKNSRAADAPSRLRDRGREKKSCFSRLGPRGAPSVKLRKKPVSARTQGAARHIKAKVENKSTGSLIIQAAPIFRGDCVKKQRAYSVSGCRQSGKKGAERCTKIPSKMHCQADNIGCAPYCSGVGKSNLGCAKDVRMSECVAFYSR